MKKKKSAQLVIVHCHFLYNDNEKKKGAQLVIVHCDCLYNDNVKKNVLNWSLLIVIVYTMIMKKKGASTGHCSL